MLSLRLFALILVTLLCREVAWSRADTLHVQSWIAMLGCCLGFGLFAKCVALRSVQQQNRQQRMLPEVLWLGIAAAWEANRKSLEYGWVMLLPAVLLLSGWGPCLMTWEDAGYPHSCALLLWFLPSLLALLFLEVTATQVEVYLQGLGNLDLQMRRLLRPPRLAVLQSSC